MSLNLSNRAAAGNRPAHAIMLLTLSDGQIIGFFYTAAGIFKMEYASERITRNAYSVFLKICTQILYFIWCSESRTRQTIQVNNCFIYIPSP